MKSICINSLYDWVLTGYESKRKIELPGDKVGQVANVIVFDFIA